MGEKDCIERDAEFRVFRHVKVHMYTKTAEVGGDEDGQRR